MSAISAVLYRESKIRATNITFIFWDLMYPLVYLLVFGVGINAALGAPATAPGVDYNAFFLAGVLAMASFGIASNTAWTFFMDRDNGIFYEMLTYPMSRSEYLVGKVLFNMFVTLAQSGLTVWIAGLVLHVPLRLGLALQLLLATAVGTVGWFFFYAIFALRIRRNDMFNTVTSIFYFVFLFVSSMFYPLDPLPRWFRVAGLLNPITWQVDVLRYCTIGLGDPARVAVEGLAFAGFTTASFVFAIRALQRQ